MMIWINNLILLSIDREITSDIDKNREENACIVHTYIYISRELST